MDGKLRLVGAVIPKQNVTPEEKRRDHERIMEEYFRSQKLRNHAENSIKKSKQNLTNFFASVGKLCWEITTDDVKDYSESLYDLGLATRTRIGYMGEVKRFFDFFTAHPFIPVDPLEVQLGHSPTRIDEKYGIRIYQPVDQWFLPKHKTDDVPQRAIPSKDQLRLFFRWIRKQIESSQKPFPLCRDYALYRMLYHTGLRINEACSLDVDDVRFDLGTIHVRFGKGTKGSGPRERYVPVGLYGLDKVLHLYLSDYRPKFLGAEKSSALFLSEWGNRLSTSNVRVRLVEHIRTARDQGVDIPIFSCHDFRRAFATHLYEEHPDKVVAIQEMLGQWDLSTTQRYIRPSKEYLAAQFTELVESRTQRLKGELYD